MQDMFIEERRKRGRMDKGVLMSNEVGEGDGRMVVALDNHPK